MAILLIVEDNLEARRLLETVVGVENYTIISCESAEEVDEKLGDAQPDLALLDINLPGEHGISLAWRLRTRWEELPILVISAILDRWDPADMRDCGVTATIRKPYNIRELRQTVHDLVCQRDLVG